MTHVFTYGTLMDAQIMADVCQAEFQCTPATLSAFRRRRVVDEPYPAITPDASETVEGLLYTNVSPDALQRLDRFEGPLYDRQIVTVIDQQGQLQTAEAYVIRPENIAQLSDEQWTLSWFQEQGRTLFVDEYRGFRDR